MSKRKLASIKRIEEIKSIDGADLICAYRVDGWWVVDQKDKYKIGDLVVYMEIDSWCPHTLAPFLSKGNEPREFEGVKGERLRSVRLKGQISQGLLLPITIHQLNVYEGGVLLSNEDLYQIDEDVTEILGILKYEKPLPTQLAGMAKGNFPSFIPKTDEERVQNLQKEVPKWGEAGLEFSVTEKLDGSSMTVFITTNSDNEQEFGVCSRNLQLKETDGNSFWVATKKYDLESKLRNWNTETNRKIAIQFELIGPGIQGNKYKLDSIDCKVFRIYDIASCIFLNETETLELCELFGLTHVPILCKMALKNYSIDSLLELAEGKSVLNTKTEREGLVFKCYTDSQPHFKAISNSFLILNRDD